MKKDWMETFDLDAKNEFSASETGLLNHWFSGSYGRKIRNYQIPANFAEEDTKPLRDIAKALRARFLRLRSN